MSPSVYIPLIIAYVVINLLVSKRINQAHYIEEERRLLHKKLIWIIPFFGAWMLRSFWKVKPTRQLDVITRKDRKTDPGGFCESGIGADVG